MDSLIFASMPASEVQALALVRSLHAFGGSLAQTPVWMFLPTGSEMISPAGQVTLESLGVRLIPFEVAPDILAFPFGAKVIAAAAAEALARDQAMRLAWMDSDTLIIQEPTAMLIPPGKQLGCCPVHHRLIGSLYDEPLDAFWSLIYERCEVPAAHVFPMQSIVDAVIIRPYINAGLLVTRPETGLLRAWCDMFTSLYRDPACESFYEQRSLYRVFIHQAVLAGTTLARLNPGELVEFPPTYNYPLHLYTQHAPSLRPAAINSLITCRYESVFSEPGWQETLPVTGHLKTWLETQFE